MDVSLATGHVRRFQVSILHDYPAMQSSSMWAGPILAGRRLVFVTGPKNGGTNRVYALSGGLTGSARSLGEGDQLWTYATGDPDLSSPAVTNGVVYIGSGDDNVYAFSL